MCMYVLYIYIYIYGRVYFVSVIAFYHRGSPRKLFVFSNIICGGVPLSYLGYRGNHSNFSRSFGTKYKYRTWYQDLVPRTLYQVLCTKYQVLGTKYLVQSIWYQVLGTKYLVPSTWYRVPSTWYRVLGSKHLVPSTWYKVLGTKYLVQSTWYHVLGTYTIVFYSILWYTIVY